MRLRNLYPLITTPHVFAARDFYTRHFGFEPLFQASWFVYLAGKNEDGCSLHREPCAVPDVGFADGSVRIFTTNSGYIVSAPPRAPSSGR